MLGKIFNVFSTFNNDVRTDDHISSFQKLDRTQKLADFNHLWSQFTAFEVGLTINVQPCRYD